MEAAKSLTTTQAWFGSSRMTVKNGIGRMPKPTPQPAPSRGWVAFARKRRIGRLIEKGETRISTSTRPPFNIREMNMACTGQLR